MSINYGKDLVIKNVNPNAENTGDCVIRSFTSYSEDELTYEEIKNEILSISKSYGSTNPHAYQRPIYFENFEKIVKPFARRVFASQSKMERRLCLVPSC